MALFAIKSFGPYNPLPILSHDGIKVSFLPDEHKYAAVLNRENMYGPHVPMLFASRQEAHQAVSAFGMTGSQACVVPAIGEVRKKGYIVPVPAQPLLKFVRTWEQTTR